MPPTLFEIDFSAMVDYDEPDYVDHDDNMEESSGTMSRRTDAPRRLLTL